MTGISLKVKIEGLVYIVELKDREVGQLLTIELYHLKGEGQGAIRVLLVSTSENVAGDSPRARIVYNLWEIIEEGAVTIWIEVTFDV